MYFPNVRQNVVLQQLNLIHIIKTEYLNIPLDRRGAGGMIVTISLLQK